MNDLKLIILIIISNVILAYSSESFNIELRPIVHKFGYKTSEPILIYTSGEDLSYNKATQEIYLYGSELSISSIKNTPINIGLGFFYGRKVPIVSDIKTGSVLDRMKMRFYLFDAFCEYQINIIGFLDVCISTKIITPYIKYDSKLNKNIAINLSPKIILSLTKWISFNCGLDYRPSDLEYKKISAFFDAEGDKDAYKVYSKVKIDNLSYQVGLSFTF